MTSVDEMREKTAKHYGRAYQCLRCLYKDDKEEVDVKRRMLAHITKYHMSMDQVAFYCRLCSFRCWSRGELEDHVDGYGPHRKEAKRLGKDHKDPRYLVSTGATYKIGEGDYKVWSRDHSIDFFLKKSGKSSTAPAVAVAAEMESVLERAARQSGVKEAAAAASYLDKLSDRETLGEEEVCVPAATEEEDPEAAQAEDQQLPLDLSVAHQEDGEENILGQLLGEAETDQRHVFRRDGEPPRKRMREVSPVASEASSTSSSSSASSMTAEQWEHVGAAIVKPLLTAMEQTTRAIRQLEKSVAEGARGIEVIARACRGMQEVMEGGAGRRREDREREERRDKGRQSSARPR